SQEFEGREQPEVVQDRRTEFMRKTSQLLGNLVEKLSDLPDALATSRRQVPGQFLERNIDGREKLPCLVVKGMRHPFAHLREPFAQAPERGTGFPDASMRHGER